MCKERSKITACMATWFLTAYGDANEFHEIIYDGEDEHSNTRPNPQT